MDGQVRGMPSCVGMTSPLPGPGGPRAGVEGKAPLSASQTRWRMRRRRHSHARPPPLPIKRTAPGRRTAPALAGRCLG